MTRPVRVEIDELVLHGFRPGDRDTIAAGLQAELAASLAGWAPATGRSTEAIDAGAFDLPPSAPGAAVGRGIGRQVRRRLAQGTGGTA